jgi:phosphate transport system protein
VANSDWKINDLELSLDEACIHILARRQPTASDLRLVIAVIRTITDLERIGDEAERIGRMARRLIEDNGPNPAVAELERLGNLVRGMLTGALDAFARMDVAQALKVAQSDSATDVEYKEVMRLVTEFMQRESSWVPRMIDIIWAARALERIGDRARNICEYVIFLVEGKDVRHTSFGKQKP